MGMFTHGWFYFQKLRNKIDFASAIISKGSGVSFKSEIRKILVLE